MEHSKGIARLSPLFTPTDTEPACHIELDGQVYFSTVSGNDVTNAQRLITCCNEHDRLKAKADLFDKAVPILKKADLLIHVAYGRLITDLYPHEVIDPLKDLLEKVKELK